jgi:predicted acylesterase/phospholipase RssA
VLADYFDYVAGTSTGAIIATCVAKGFSASRIREFYIEGARSLLTPAPIWRRFNYFYLAQGFVAKLKSVFGDETLGSDSLRTLLMLVLRNADTDSPWPLSNNPAAKYNDPLHPGSNLLVSVVATGAREHRRADLFPGGRNHHRGQVAQVRRRSRLSL